MRRTRPAAAIVALTLAALASASGLGAEPRAPAPGTAGADTAVATFAGGCFWCMEAPFDALDGVVSTTSGYTGGTLPDPTYEQVSAGATNHAEAVQVIYDPERIHYAQLVDVFWRNIDPLDASGQFCDRGPQYRSAVFVHDAEQRRVAEASRRKLEQSGRFERAIATKIETATDFWPAEDYHQDYYRKNPIRYRWYRSRCGRDRRLKERWGESAH